MKGKEREDFSVVIIARNEEKMLPRLLDSLKGVEDIVVCDTGSTDKTVEVAKKYGCNVVEAGDQFAIPATQEQVDTFRKLFDLEPHFKAGDKQFHFSKARNYATKFAKNDWIFQPDADEIVQWDLEKVRDAIQDEDHLVYRFCYAHNQPDYKNPDWSCGLEFEHSKFYRRSLLTWKKWVHEIPMPIEGKNPKPPKYVDFIYHHHWQNPSTTRGNYLRGLELSVLENPEDERNIFYLAREYFYEKEYETAIKMFDKALEIMSWKPERGQAYIFKGQCHAALNQIDEAYRSFGLSLIECDTRREPWNEMGLLAERQEDWQKAIKYMEGALATPFTRHGYLNEMNLYGWVLEDKLAFLYGRVGDTEKSKEMWRESVIRGAPPQAVRAGLDFFYKETPKVSIVVPTVRPEGFQRLKESIERNTAYPNYEIIKKEDTEGRGCVTMFNEGVEEAEGKYIVFLADDTEVEKNWLTLAYVHFRERFKHMGLVILNDGYWGDRMAHHFFCSKNIREVLDGEIMYHGYKHVGIDNELKGRLDRLGLCSFEPNAKFIHHHYCTQTMGTEASVRDEYYKLIESYQPEDRELLYKRQKEVGFGPRVAVFCTTYNNESIIEEFVTENLKYVDEIYISDNDSTDDTRKVAEKAGAFVRNSKIVHTPQNYNEGETKQQALEFALTGDCDWLLYLDSDEILEERAKDLLPQYINDERYDAYGMRLPTFWLNREEYRVDGDFASYVSHPYPLKLFRRNIGIKMTIPPKGAHSFPAVNGDPAHPRPERTIDAELMIKHYGYIDIYAVMDKYNRYRRADPESVMSLNKKAYEHIHPEYKDVVLVKWGVDEPILEEVVNKGNLCFDIGANKGHVTQLMKKYGAAKVVSVEPNPEIVKDIVNDIVIQKAAGAKSGEKVTLYLPNSDMDSFWSVLGTLEKDRANHPFYERCFQEGRNVEVETITLDDLIAEYGEPDFIKIDVEGYEPEVLRGLSFAPKYLSFEINERDKGIDTECAEMLLKLADYEFRVTYQEEWFPRTNWANWEETRKFLEEKNKRDDYWNIYCRRRS